MRRAFALGAIAGYQQVADEDDEEPGHDRSGERASTKCGSLDVENAVSCVRSVSTADHDAEGHEIGQREDDSDGERDSDRLPGTPPAQDQDDGDDRQEREDEAVDDPERRSLRDAAVDLFAHPMRPPARDSRRRDENGEHHEDEAGACPHGAAAPVRPRRGLGAHSGTRLDSASTVRYREEGDMSVAKVVEISSSSPTSFEDAVKNGIDKAGESLRGIKGAWVSEEKVDVENGVITAYRVTLRVSFVLE